MRCITSPKVITVIIWSFVHNRLNDDDRGVTGFDELTSDEVSPFVEPFVAKIEACVSEFFYQSSFGPGQSATTVKSEK